MTGWQGSSGYEALSKTMHVFTLTVKIPPDTYLILLHSLFHSRYFGLDDFPQSIQAFSSKAHCALQVSCFYGNDIIHTEETAFWRTGQGTGTVHTQGSHTGQSNSDGLDEKLLYHGRSGRICFSFVRRSSTSLFPRWNRHVYRPVARASAITGGRAERAGH